ncbi:hypothetical protein CDV31_015081 [Fusarium ambrosium]|uniref:Uncharacterized protein n=1 Tax=Fusarium ambrosium TaxID=131363 RepID=A0A428SS52_9HYPO|nr:hypothetical protein CDV31_015081 [Fusarium ambrosium]
MDSQAAGWTTNSLGGQPLVPNNGMPHPSGPDWHRGNTRPYQPSYESQGHASDASTTYMGYPSNSVQYPTGPDMQSMGPSGASSGTQQAFSLHQLPNPNGYDAQQYPRPTQFNPWVMRGYQTVAGTTQMHHTPPPPPPTTPPLRPRTPKDDPEKIRLEAEIATFKAMLEKQKEAEKQREVEAKIRKEAEEAFHERMEEMRIVQEEAKKEIEIARSQAEQAAKNRMRAEQDSEEERSKRMKEFAEKLERDVRAKVELEKIAEMAERKAKAKQNEDLERLVKLKMLKSMDEIVVLAKKRVLHDVATGRDMCVGATEEQDWLMERRGETEGENNLSPDDDLTEKSNTSVTHSTIPLRHAKATTLRSVPSASVRRQDIPPTGSWAGPPLAVPDAPVLGDASDDGGTLGRAGTDILDPSESGRGSQAHHRQQGIYKGQRHRDMYQNDGTQQNEALVDQIADAVVARLMQSPYKEALIRHPPQRGQYYHQPLRPTTKPFDATSYRYPKDGVPDCEDAAGRFHKGGPPSESSRRSVRPPKPAHLRGRSIKGSDGL